MICRIAVSVLSLLLLGGTLAAPATSGETPRYVVTDLGAGYGRAINDDGLVAGYATGADGSARAAVWDSATGEKTDLGLADSFATAINADGVVAGWARTAAGTRAFVCSGGSITELEPLSGDTTSYATGINASGQVSGWSEGSSGARAVVWTDGEPAALDGLGGSGAQAMAINDAGQTAGGGATTGDTVSHACLWDPESGIGDLDDGSETRWSQACGMNSSGDVVGTSSYAAEYYYESYAMLWKDGAAKRLGAGGIYGFDVNDASDEHGVQIAGRILTDRGWGHAALWEIDAEGEITATDLDELLHPTNTGEGILGSAMAINARGQIVTAYGRDGHVRVLTPSWMLPPPPSPPASPSAAGGSEHVAIRWSPVETADSYAVKRATASGGPYDTLASGLTSVSEYLDRTASLGSTYFYVVTAENAAGESDPSSEVSAAPRPFPPPNLAAVLNRSRYGNQVNLRWSLSPSANVVQYKVYRRAIPKDVLLATLGSVTSTTVKELARGTTYTYCITAVHASGRESLLSKFASVTTP